MNILETIIANKKNEVQRQKEAVSIDCLNKIIKENGHVPDSFRKALEMSDSGIIAEFKRKSPSKGWIAEDADVAGVTAGYESSGATAVSVLTDEIFFGGTFDDFKMARSMLKIPLLRKDFIVDEYQVYQSRAMGADVILLIASALSKKQVLAWSLLAHNLGLQVLLEIHNEAELDYIMESVDVVGINNRNLTTFETDVQCSFRLGQRIPDRCVKISESGITDPKIVAELRRAGFKGFLMGENFMKTDSPSQKLEEFIKELRIKN